MRGISYLFLLSLFGAAQAFGQTFPQSRESAAPGSVPRPLSVPVEVSVPLAPTAFKAGGRWHLVYELHITNLARSEGELLGIDVLTDAGKLLADYKGDGLIASMVQVGAPLDSEMTKIGTGRRTIVYMWLTMDGTAEVPAALEHRLRFKLITLPDALELIAARIPVGDQASSLSPPLHGGEWLAGNGPSNTSGHRRSIIPINGHLYIAQRFATDWVRLLSNGDTYDGDAKDNRNYGAYGAEALAVADGVVAAIKDGIPENIPGPTSRAVPITLETIGGNYVILDLGKGRFAFYGHLQPGKLRIKVGDRVSRGQVLGLVGNSGNSTQPHLHFHLSETNSPLGAEGLPYVLTSFEVQGKAVNRKYIKTMPEKRTQELPLESEVVRFLP